LCSYEQQQQQEFKTQMKSFLFLVLIFLSKFAF